MKKLGLSFMSSALGIFLIPTVVMASSDFTFVKVVPPPVEKRPLKEVVNVEYLMTQAIDIHTTLVQVPQLKDAQKKQVERIADLEKTQKRLEALNECNTKRLKDQFKDPEETWNRITSIYDQREKDLAIYINSSEPPSSVSLERKTDINNYTDQELSEMLLHWSLGNEIMTDVYANQDKWGTRKAPKSPSFPLWSDQKFFYDKTWGDKYTKLNAYFGVPPQGRPIITDEVKYDYNRADEMVSAHNAYMAKLTASDPKRALAMPAELRQPPEVAPKPLPPVKESVLYIGNVEKSHQIFPAWPEPWQKQIDNNFANFNMRGELAKDFVARSFRVKDEIAQQGALEQNNRLNVYQQQKKAVDSAKKLVEVSTLDISETKNIVQNGLDRNNIKASAGSAKLEDEKSYAILQEKIKDEKFSLIEKIEKNVTGHPREVTIRATINALKKDPSGKTYISTISAPDIDQSLLEAASAEALIKEQEKFAQNEKKKQDKPIDDMCLNGGM